MPPDPVDPAAANASRRGVELLARGHPIAAFAALRDAVATDERSVPANIALAAAAHEVGDHDAWRVALMRAVTLRHASRRERQHVAVIALVLEGNLARASVLGREHLGEFPTDDLVRHVLARGGVDLTDLGADHMVDVGGVDGAASRRGRLEGVVAEHNERGGASDGPR